MLKESIRGRRKDWSEDVIIMHVQYSSNYKKNFVQETIIH